MKQIRLLPVVVMAASALLVLKTFGIVSGQGYILNGVQMAQAQDAEGEQPAYDPDALEAAAEALFEAFPSSAPDGGAPVPIEAGASSSEAAILQRLAERRAELDGFAAELDTRLAVVEAAEIRIEERMAELSAMEAQINAMMDAQETAEAEQFAAIVAMYENMRPADAATIFNDLDTEVLVRVGRAMKPRRLGPIMAKMTPANAQQLTVLLAQTGPTGPTEIGMPDFSSLPQIVGQ